MGYVSFAERGGGKGGEGSCSSHCIVMLFIALHWLGLHIRFLVGFSLNLSSYGYVFLFPWTPDKTLNEERKYIQKVCSLSSNVQKHFTPKILGSALFSCHQKKKKCWRDVYFDDFVSREIFDCCASIFLCYIYFICISAPFVQEKPHKWWYIFPTIRLFYRVESCSDVRKSYAVWYFSSVERSRYVKYNGNPIK